ncbi:T9SS type A sorting domain-containing protein [bacterium]|nr:T9SS type A sorting domain-containing protein [bacterium]
MYRPKFMPGVLLTILIFMNIHAIEVYFNKHSNGPGGDTRLDQKFCSFISQAEYSIDICFYNITLPLIRDSLLSAYRRGVSIRMITEADNRDHFVFEDLSTAGIPIIDDNFPGSGGSNYMHHKFAIRDARGNSDPDDDWIWTGSWNASYSNTFPDANNVVIIQDQCLAEQYSTEFNEMWGSESEIPQASNSRFHTRKTDNNTHICLNDHTFNIYFSPSDGSTQAIINALNTANYEIYFCIMAFTFDTLAHFMRDKYEGSSNLILKGVFDSGMWDNTSSISMDMRGLGSDPWAIQPPVFPDSVGKEEGEDGILHHKYMIIDPNHPQSDPIVITGSMNWSNNGEYLNDENTLIIHNAQVTRLFLSEFEARFTEAGGILVPPKILVQNYPNPFYDNTHIYFHRDSLRQRSSLYDQEGYIPVYQEGLILIYNILGKQIRTFMLDSEQNSITWDGTDQNGIPQPSGIYFYTLSYHNHQISKKMVFLNRYK